MMHIISFISLAALCATAVSGSHYIHAAPWSMSDISTSDTKIHLAIRAETETFPYWTDRPILFPPKPIDGTAAKAKRPESAPPAQNHALNASDIENMFVTNGQWRIGNLVLPATYMCIALEAPDSSSNLHEYACMSQSAAAQDWNTNKRLRKRNIGLIAGLIVVCVVLAIVCLAFLLFWMRRRKRETHPGDVAQRELAQAEKTLKEAQEKDPNSRKTKKAEKRFRELQARTQTTQLAAPAATAATA